MRRISAVQQALLEEAQLLYNNVIVWPAGQAYLRGSLGRLVEGLCQMNGAVMTPDEVMRSGKWGGALGLKGEIDSGVNKYSVGVWEIHLIMNTCNRSCWPMGGCRVPPQPP